MCFYQVVRFLHGGILDTTCTANPKKKRAFIIKIQLGYNLPEIHTNPQIFWTFLIEFQRIINYSAIDKKLLLYSTLSQKLHSWLGGHFDTIESLVEINVRVEPPAWSGTAGQFGQGTRTSAPAQTNAASWRLTLLEMPKTRNDGRSIHTYYIIMLLPSEFIATLGNHDCPRTVNRIEWWS